MRPEPGPYGPVDWSVPRPPTLWAAIALFLLASFTRYLTSGAFVPGALLGAAVVLYLLVRGSRVWWYFTVIGGSLSAWGSIALFFTAHSRGAILPSPEVSLVAGVLEAVAVILLGLPQTRHFFDLERRHSISS